MRQRKSDCLDTQAAVPKPTFPFQPTFNSSKCQKIYLHYITKIMIKFSSRTLSSPPNRPFHESDGDKNYLFSPTRFLSALRTLTLNQQTIIQTEE